MTTRGDLTPASFTVMRFTEWGQSGIEQSGMADPQGTAVCIAPIRAALKACPAPGAIVQYTNGKSWIFVHEKLHRPAVIA